MYCIHHRGVFCAFINTFEVIMFMLAALCSRLIQLFTQRQRFQTDDLLIHLHDRLLSPSWQIMWHSHSWLSRGLKRTRLKCECHCCHFPGETKTDWARTHDQPFSGWTPSLRAKLLGLGSDDSKRHDRWITVQGTAGRCVSQARWDPRSIQSRADWSWLALLAVPLDTMRWPLRLNG